MITRYTTGLRALEHIAIVSPTRLTDEQALKQLDAASRRRIKRDGFRRCPFLPNCWHLGQTKAECKRSCRETMIRRARRGEL